MPSDTEPEIFADITPEDEASFSEPDSEDWVDSDPEDEEPHVPEMPPRHGQLPRRAPDHYAPVNRVVSANRAPYDVTPCSFRRMSQPTTHMMKDPDWDTEMGTHSNDRPCVNMNNPLHFQQAKSPPCIQWWPGHH